MESFSMLTQANAPWFVGWGTLALINAGLAQGSNLFEKARRIDDDAIGDDRADMRPQDAGGQQR